MSNIVIPRHPPDLVGQFPARFFGFQDPGFGFQAQGPLLEVEPAGGVDLHDDGSVVACLDELKAPPRSSAGSNFSGLSKVSPVSSMSTTRSTASMQISP